MTQTVTLGFLKTRKPSCLKNFENVVGTVEIVREWFEKVDISDRTVAHNPEVVGSNPIPATIKTADFARNQRFFFAKVLIF